MEQANYPIALSIDLRVFDNQQRDYGVEHFIQRLGFVPHYLFLHETYVGQIHSHDGLLDDTPLLPTWSAQRGLPGCQTWTRGQYRALIDTAKEAGIRFFQGAEAAWSQWPEYGPASRDTWIYDHIPELFTTYRNGLTSRDEMGMICPLKRLKDGTYYQDTLLRDLLRYLDDYNMEGFFAADGFGGLATHLADGDYSDDMVDQFTLATGIRVPGANIPARAAYIWQNLRYEWITFYSDRWASFYATLTQGMRAVGKDLIVMAPFKHGPADALVKYGYDYAKNAAAGLDFYALESMETNSHRWQNMQSCAASGISNVTSIKAVAPNTRILWMSAACNTPEHWHTLRDHPSMLERECIALNTARTIGPDGAPIKGFDGVQPLFGIDLDAQEWRWYKERLDIGHMEVAYNEGLVNIWSDVILYEHAKRGVLYPYTTESVRLRFAGLPIDSAVHIDHVEQVKNKTLLLIQPLGITDGEVERLARLVEGGKILVVAGNVESPALLKLMGVQRGEKPCAAWKQAASNEIELPQKDGAFSGGALYYICVDAVSVADAMNEGTEVGACLSARAVGQGHCIAISDIREAFPDMRYRLDGYHRTSHPSALAGPPTGLSSIREVSLALAQMHPDAYDTLCARLIQTLDGTFPYADRGQVSSCVDTRGRRYLFCQNPINSQYLYMDVTLPKDKRYVEELPIRRNGPMGYQYFGDTRPRHIEVCLPPEGLIPFRIEYRA